MVSDPPSSYQLSELTCDLNQHMGGFPKNMGKPPNHPMFNRVFHEINHPFGGTIIFGNTHVSTPWFKPVVQTSDFKSLIPSNINIGGPFTKGGKELSHGQKNPAGYFPLSPGCLKTGSLFHGL